ncbi:hypothetical protein MMC21_007971 [Puttea exsequens]|nr:hypothetical protein [Puttea exsequens]
MGDPLDQRYIARDLQSLLADHGAVNRMSYGVTSPGGPNIAATITITTVQNPANLTWTFQCTVPRNFTDWWIFTNGSSEGLRAGRYQLGDIKTAPGDPGYDLDIDKTYNAVPGPAYGTYRIVRGSLVNSEGAWKELIGPADADGERDGPMTKNHVYSFFLDCDAATAAHIKASEREHVNDFGEAYNLLFPRFAAAANAIPPQASQDALWKALWNGLVGKDYYLRGAVPDDPADFNSLLAWRSRLAVFWGDLCDLTYVRDRGADAKHNPMKYLVVWADGVGWNAQVSVAGQMRQLAAGANQCIVSILSWPENSPTSREVVNARTALTTASVQRDLAPI